MNKKFFSVIMALILIMGLIPTVSSKNILSALLAQNSRQVLSESVINADFKNYKLPENLKFTDISSQKSTSRSAKSLIYSIIGALVPVDFTENEVKALAIAVHTQLCHDNDYDLLSIDTQNSLSFLNEKALKQKFGNNCTTLCSYCDNVYECIIFKNGSPADLKLRFDGQEPSHTNRLIKANPYSSLSSDYSVDTAFDKDVFFAKLKELNSEIDTSISPQQAVGEITYDESGSVQTISICKKDFSGEDIAKAFSLPHKNFTLLYSLDEFRFTSLKSNTLSTINPDIAHFMSLQGNTYKEILSYVFN